MVNTCVTNGNSLITQNGSVVEVTYRKETPLPVNCLNVNNGYCYDCTEFGVEVFTIAYLNIGVADSLGSCLYHATERSMIDNTTFLRIENDAFKAKFKFQDGADIKAISLKDKGVADVADC